MLHPLLCPGSRGAVVYIDWCITFNTYEATYTYIPLDICYLRMTDIESIDIMTIFGQCYNLLNNNLRYTIKYNFLGYLVKKIKKTSCSASQPLATWTSENRIIVSCTRGFVVITSRQFPSSLCLCFKTCLVPNHSYEKDFDFHKRQHIGGTHCQVNGFALELVLTQKRN